MLFLGNILYWKKKITEDKINVTPQDRFGNID